MSKKNAYKVLAEAFATGGLKNVVLPTSRVNHRRLSVDEIKEHIMEEFEAAKKSSDVSTQEFPGGWGDAELEHEIDWMKSLDLKEAIGEE